MLPTPREIEQAAIGCWELMRGREAGTARFNLTMDGFWRSFLWAFVLAILDAIDALYLRAGGIGDSTLQAHPAVVVLIVGGLTSFAGFIAFPIVVAGLARIMHLGKAYAPYIIVRNWLTVFLSIPVYLIDLLSVGNILPDALRDAVTIALVVVSLVAGTMIARLVLKVSWSLASGFAFLDFLLLVFISEAAARLLG